MTLANGLRRGVLSTAILVASLSLLHAADDPAKWVRLDVPYVPTPPVVIDAMLKVASVSAGDVLYDLGSGDGRIAIAAVRDRGASRAVGIDINPARVAEAAANAKAAGVDDRTSFIEGDVFKADFRDATVVTMYLLENVNLRLRPRLLNELRPGTRIVSHQFHMFDWPPDDVVMVLDKIPVYFWVVPARVQGTWTGQVDGQAARFDLAQKFQFVIGGVVIGDAAGKVTQAKMTGDALALEVQLTRDGRNQVLQFEAKLGPEGLAGALTVDGKTREVALQRAAGPGP